MRVKSITAVVALVALVALVFLALTASAGNPVGPGTQPDSTYSYTLEDIYNRLNDGTAGSQSTFTEPSSGPGTGTMHTLNDIMALASANADPPCFDNANRYVDCGNGTVTDTVTGLTWLKNANCFGKLSYAHANDAAAGLKDGDCSLTDNSRPGDWRLPTEGEWEATVEQARDDLSCGSPMLTDIPGTGCYAAGSKAFTDVKPDNYWSSTAFENAPGAAQNMNLSSGTGSVNGKTATHYVWPVRGGQ